MKFVVLLLGLLISTATFAGGNSNSGVPAKRDHSFGCVVEDRHCQKLREIAIQFGGCQFDAWNTEIVYQCYGGAQPRPGSDLSRFHY